MKANIDPNSTATACVVVTSSVKMTLEEWNIIRGLVKFYSENAGVGKGQGLRFDLCTSVTEEELR